MEVTGNIVLFQDDLEVTKSELGDVQKQNSQFRNDIDILTEQLDREKASHEDAVAEVGLMVNKFQVYLFKFPTKTSLTFFLISV